MANGVFNISKGAFVEKIRDSGSVVLLLLLKVAEADATLVDYDDLAALLAGANTEADFTNYARKTAITGTITVDDTNDRSDVDISDQTFSSAGGASNNDLVKAILAYEEAAADATRIPMTHHDFTPTTDGNDLTVQIHTDGFGRAA